MLAPLIALAITAASPSPTLTVMVEPIDVGSVPRGAQRVVMLRLELAASCAADIPLDSIRVRHAGAGIASDLLRVSALEQGRRLTRSVAPQSRSGEAVLHFRRFAVPSCGRRVIDIAADVAADAAGSGEHRLEVQHAGDVVSGMPGTFVQLFSRAQMSTNTQPVTRVAGTTYGNVTAQFLTVPQPITYGAHRMVARLRLSADGADDQLLEAITLINDGKARGVDLQNLVLLGSNGVVLSKTLPSLDGDRARFVFDPPLRLDRNAERVVVVRGDVRAGRTKTIEFILEEESDIEARVVRGRR